MQITTFYVGIGEQTAEESLNAFLKGHRVTQVEKAFTGTGWAFCVEWVEGKVENDWKNRPRLDYKQLLPPDVFARFAKLREVRKNISEEDGVPPYVVMTDSQLAEAAKVEMITMTHLETIPGFGQGKLAKFGARLIAGYAKGGSTSEQ